MKALLFFLLTVGALSFSACKKEIPPVDRCATNNCQNGSTCDNGVCDCPPNYTGVHCQILQVPPCTNVNCGPNSTCVNGTCKCDPGWRGDSCTIAVTVNHLYIDTIIITTFPTTNNGSSWDPFPNPESFPDIVLSVDEGPFMIKDFITETIDNADGSTSLYYYDDNYNHIRGYTHPLIRLNYLYHPNSIRLWDRDELPDEDDLMRSITFTPINLSTNEPRSFTLTSSDLVITFKVRWGY